MNLFQRLNFTTTHHYRNPCSRSWTRDNIHSNWDLSHSDWKPYPVWVELTRSGIIVPGNLLKQTNIKYREEQEYIDAPIFNMFL
jgi:hypothetical protein